MTANRRFRVVGVLLIAAMLVAACASDGGGNASPSTSAPTVDGDADTTDTDDAEAVEVETTTTLAPQPDLAFFDPPEADPTPLEIDGETRIGVLDNGLTYYVRSNSSPGSSVSLRLAIRAGGVHEDPIGTGAAHFLEHMMFNGTAQFPGNTLDAALRRIGAEIGPDFNAYTSPTETVYQIDVEDRADNVEVAFDVLSEWASAATIDPVEVAAEEPVVREELRLRKESGAGLIRAAFAEAYYLGTPYEGVNLEGTVESLGELTADDLRAYYDAWYRPDNMAVIAVGDRSLDALEDLIVDRFGDLSPRGATPGQPDTALEELRQDPYVDVIIEPSFSDSYISVDIPVQSWDPSTVGGNELILTEVILGLMIDNRLSEGVDSGRLDLRRARGGWFPYNRDLAYLGFNLDADDLVSGTETFMTELRGSIQNPFSQSELDRAVEVIENSIEQQVAQFNSTQDVDFADTMVRHFVGGADLRSIDDIEMDTFDFLERMNLDEVNNHYGWMMTSSAPLVIIVGPNEERTGTIDDHLGAIERANQAVIDGFVDDVEEIDDLVADPAPVQEIERRALARLEGVELVFDNGARVLFSPSSIAEEQVFVLSSSPGGRAVLPADRGSIAPTAVNVVSASGVGEWDPIQVRRYLADLDVSVTPYVADFSEGISASAASTDLDALLELMYLQLTEPRVDGVPLRQQQEFARDAVERASVDSSTAATVAVQDLRTGGGRFASQPTVREIDDLTSDDALEIWNDRFGSLDDHVFVIVGDVDEDEVVDLARRWIGTLPGPVADEFPEQPPLPGIVNERLGVGSGSASGSYRLLIVGESDETIRNRVLAELAQTVLNDRIFTVIREELGATYGGSAFIEFSDPGDEVELYVSIDGDPARIDEIADVVGQELALLRDGGLTADDFNEAVSILASEYNFISNGFIIEMLFDEALRSDDRIIDRDAQRTILGQLAPNDVSAFLGAVLSNTDRVDVRNVPVN